MRTKLCSSDPTCLYEGWFWLEEHSAGGFSLKCRVTSENDSG